MTDNCINIRRAVKIALCGLYFSSVFYFSIFDSCKYVFLIIPIITILWSIVIKKTMERIALICEAKVLGKKTECNFKIVVVSFLIIFGMQMVYWFAFFPGGFNLDAYGQWDQVHGLMQWNNWHPVLTTLLYWILTRIIDSLAFCIFVQILIFSISVSMVLLELYKHGVSSKGIVICALFIAINPAIGMNNVCLIKDVPFTIGIVWLFWGVLRMFYSNGEWLGTFRGQVFLAIEIVTLSLIRHNAILLLLPFVTVLIYNYRKLVKKIIIMSVFSIISIGIIEFVIFPIANIEQHSNVVGEMVGIPMAAMANALVTDYEDTPECVKEFLEDIADDDTWKNYYITGEWDSCKWEFGGIDLLKDESLTKIISLFVETSKNCPEAVYDSLRENTRVVWQVFGYNEWNTWVYIEANDYGIEENYNICCEQIVDWLEKISNTIVGGVFSWNIGCTIVAYIVITLYMEAVGNTKLNAILYAILSYDMFTMLLLAGPSHRYFYFNSVLIFPIILVAFSEYGLKQRRVQFNTL